MRALTRWLFMESMKASSPLRDRLFQCVHVVLDVRPDAFADGNGLKLREPCVALITSLEQRRGSERRAGRGRLADAVVRHQDQGTIVGLQREPHVEAVTAVGAVGNPVARRYLHRAFEARSLEAPADDLDDGPRAL